MFSPAESAACQRLIALALEEDLGAVGDVTSQAVIPAELEGRAVFLAKASGVVGGLPAVELVLKAVDAGLGFDALVPDGARVAQGDAFATVTGSMRSILAAERTALNFLQHLSGIATLTRRFLDEAAGAPAKVLDTRKTLPGWRLLAKYAVRCGGGHNHRMGLYDGVLIKDNHLAALGIEDVRLRMEEALRRARRTPRPLPVEIEVDSLEQLDHALAFKPAIILLDNMSADMMREAVQRRNQRAPEVLLEASGGVTLQSIRSIASTGVDRISVGALTHSAPALDIALDYAT